MAEEDFFPDPQENEEDHRSEWVLPLSVKTPHSLEDSAIHAYLRYLESEVVAYIGLTQNDSRILRGVASRLMEMLMHQINSVMSGIASSVLRQKMLRLILSDRFPSPHNCNMFRPQVSDDSNDDLDVSLHSDFLGNGDQVYSHCSNPCCTGAFIQEAMSGIVMSADIHELVFTSDQVKTRRKPSFDGQEFNIPVVLTHLSSATHQHFSQLERLIFSDNFVKEDASLTSLTEEGISSRLRHLPHYLHDPFVTTKLPRKVLENYYRKQDRFAKHFAAVSTQAPNGRRSSIYCSADRRGLALGLLVMFRDVAPSFPLNGGPSGFYKLTEIVLKNNIQCPLYSKANFQFELLARIGFCCPRLKVLDLFGTDTWADCLVAFFFRDAFHSVHRYLFFMENEEDEESAYHPHDLSRYCQFCLDGLHPVAAERPFTINPVIPLLDQIYDHVIKKYPKRSYCILRNCVKVSHLIQCPNSKVFELQRPRSETDPLDTHSCSTANSCQVHHDHSVQSRETDDDASDEDYVEVRDDGVVEADSPVCRELSSSCSIKSRLRSAALPSKKEPAKVSFAEDRSKKIVNVKQLGKSGFDDERETRDSLCPSAAAEFHTEKVKKGGTYTILSRHEKPLTVTVFGAISQKSSLTQSSNQTEKPTSERSLLSSMRRTTRLKAKCKELENKSGTGDAKEQLEAAAIDGVAKSRQILSDPGPICKRCCHGPVRKHCNDFKQGRPSKPPEDAKDFRNAKSNVSEPMMLTRSKKRKLQQADGDVGAKKRFAFVSETGRANVPEETDDVKTAVTFDEWQKETTENWREQQQKHHACQEGRYENAYACTKAPKRESAGCDDCSSNCSSSSSLDWASKNVRYREISEWPHLNDCVESLEILNIGGTNVLGEFIPFILLNAKRLKSMGQWINTMIYGLEILRQLPGHSEANFPLVQEFSYSTDRNYFCQPYIGFVPGSVEYKNVRKEMVRQSGRVAKRLGHSARNHASKRKQLEDDVNLMVDTCPNCRKLNLVLHYKQAVLDEFVDYPWTSFAKWDRLKELDLVAFRFGNVKSLLKVVGPKLESLTLEMDDEQGNGSEIVHIARHCTELKSLRLLIGDKVLRGEMTLHFGTQFFQQLERLTVEGSVHLHGFAFLWGHCKNLSYMKIGQVVSNEVTTHNVLIHDVFTLLFQVNKMAKLEEMHVKNLKIRSIAMGKFLLDNLPNLKKASNWIIDVYNRQLLPELRQLIRKLKQSRGLEMEVTEAY